MLDLKTLAPGEWIAAAESGAAVVTVSSRLQRYLHEQVSQHYVKRKGEVWATPTILPWGVWLERIWQEQQTAAASGAPAKGAPQILLQASQEAVLWQEIVAADPDAPSLLRSTALAADAEDAWRLVHAWELDLNALLRARGLAPEVERFGAWARHYLQRCALERWTDRARLASQVAAGITAGTDPIPPRVILAGFDAFEPSQVRLLQALTQRGTECVRLPLPVRAGGASRIALPDPESEAETALRWARGQAEAGAVSVGIVVQGLASRRTQMLRLARAILAPGSALPTGAEEPLPFHLSLGPSLAEVPLIQAGLRLLHLRQGPIAVDEWEAALLSPYVGDAESERERRGELAMALRRRGDFALSLATVEREAQRAQCVALSRRLHEAQQLLASAPRTRSFGAWAQHTTDLLRALGWPNQGGPGLTSAEYQAHERWADLLDEWCALDGVLAPESRDSALGRLQEIARAATFQPQADPAPIQILGHLEAAGLEFDRLWVMGLDDESWPRPPQPNPLLPIALQRSHAMPRASADQELAFAEAVTARLRTSADRIVFSHGQHQGAAIVRPSPLIADLPEIEPNALDLWSSPSVPSLIRAHGRLEARAELPLRALQPKTEVPHGASVFADMAACPFRGQALHRWRAEEAALANPGLSPADHGTLLHAVLQKVWADLKAQSALLALDEVGVQAAVERSVGEALSQFAHERLTPGLSKLENARLVRLATGLLELDRARPPFAVTSAETSQTAEAGGVIVKVRMDRVDTLLDHSRLLLDYKSGRVQPSQWLGERPDAPQLPLYAIALKPPAAALAFVQVRTGELRYAGVSDADLRIPGVVPTAEWKAGQAQQVGATWGDALAQWEAVLTRLGDQFRTGDAEVDPKTSATCSRCALPALCRIDERGALVRAVVTASEGGDAEGDDGH
jgi:ATP-dependent helicase/nuclease subunit B